MNKAIRFFFLGFVLILLVSCDSTSVTGDSTASVEKKYDLLISQDEREPVPNLEFMTFDGKRFDAKDHIGKLGVINFWASWCGPCRLEASVFEHAYKKYNASDGVVFVGIAVQDRVEAAKNFVKEFSVSYPNGIDETGVIGGVFNIFAIPQTFILDKKGRIAMVYVGAILDDEIFDEVLGRLIKE